MPSIPLIIYGSITEESIGKLFIGHLRSGISLMEISRGSLSSGEFKRKRPRKILGSHLGWIVCSRPLMSRSGLPAKCWLMAGDWPRQGVKYPNP